MSHPPRPADPPERLPLTRRDVGLVVGFWTVYGLLGVAGRVFDRGPGPEPGRISGSVVVAIVEAGCWMLLTPVVFDLAARFGGRRKLALDLALLAGVGLAIAAVLSTGGEAIRDLYRGLPRRGPPPGGPPLWFGFLNGLVIYLGVLAAGFARAYSLRYRLRREQTVQLQGQLAEAHLDALRRQLDPHFLFNTLNAISSLVERDPRGVRRMIARLGELLRHSLEGADDPEIPLRQELALLDRYLDIMQVRFQGKLEVRQRIQESALDAMVPTLVLQPLVENAIRHGVERLAEGGRIAVEATIDDGMLVLRVRDNGPNPDPYGASGDGRTGVGLSNTVARLERLYGPGQRFTLSPASTGGMVAEVRLPLRIESVVHG